MTIKDVKEISKMIPAFVQMCENDMEEDEHEIKKPLSYEDYERISKLIKKLNTCESFVNLNIFY